MYGIKSLGRKGKSEMKSLMDDFYSLDRIQIDE
jgi:hypothetical protein